MKQPFACLMVFLTLCGNAFAFGHPPKANTAPEYADADQHPNEHVSIAAEPFDTEESTHFFRLPYLKYGFMPIRIIVTNVGDKPISLSDVRIQFLSAANDRLPAAIHDEIFRSMTHNSDASPRKIPLPIPITIPRKPLDQKIDQDMNEFGITSLVVEPHTTVSGFLFYDISNIDKPALHGAQIYVKMVKDADGKELFPFTIDLDKQPGK